MAYKNRIIYILLLLIVCSSSYRLSATSHSDSTRHHLPKPHPSVSAPTTVLTQRQFASLEAFVQAQAQTISTQPIHITAPAEFTEVYIRDNFTVAAAVADARDSAKAAFSQIEKTNNYVESFAIDNLLELPVGIKKRVGNSEVVVGIVKAHFYKDYAEMTVFCKMELPQKEGSSGARLLFFGADNVRFSRRGVIEGTPKLVLLGDAPIPINGGNSLLTLRGGFDMRTGQVDSLTYAKFSCNGIEEIGISAELSFSRNLIIPLNATTLDTLSSPSTRVKGTFRTIVRDWNDIVATVSLPPFAIRDMDKIAFVVRSATFDFSDISTPNDIAFPYSYQVGNLLPPNKNLWRGVYIKNATMYLPKEFKIKGSTGRVAIAADSLIIDQLGFSGRISAHNIYQKGTASKWDMSLDKFELELVANSLRSGGFNGAIALPVTASRDTHVSGYGMLYSAVFTSRQDYLLSVQVKDTVSFDFWKARAKLYAGTYISLEVQDTNFLPKAVLNGKMAVTGFKQNDSTELAGIVFQGFMIQASRANQPRFGLQYAGYVVDTSISNQLSKFPLTIDTLALSIVNDDVSLRVGFRLVLGDSNRFAASSIFNIIGTLKDSANRVSYVFKELKVENISLSGDFNAFKLDGTVNIYKSDPVMGKGFGGRVKMTMNMGDKPITIDVALAFGRVKDYKYWYVDAAVSGFRWDLAPGLAVTGLGGGAWNKMIKTNRTHSDLRMMPTGSSYTPNSEAGFGFRAMTQFVVGAKSTAQGNLCLEVLFNNSGGVNRILLYGGAVIMPSLGLRQLASNSDLVKNKLVEKLSGLNSQIASTGVGSYLTSLNTVPVKQTAERRTPEPDAAEKSTIAIKLGIEYNFVTRVLDGNFDVNMSLGNGIITGSGNARMYFSPNKWYIHVGKPSTPINAFFNIPGIRAQAKLYYMVGTDIEPGVDIPAVAASILGPDKLQTLHSMRNMSSLSSGKGLSTGASFNAQLNYDFSFIYARFGGGIGYDIMVKDYGDMRCQGYLDPIGIQGWYASGQAYAYVQGDLGIRVRLRFVSRDISLIRGNAALLLQSKLPKPSWFSGYLAGSYSLLGGLVRGGFNCNLTLGDNCEIINNNTIVTSEQDFIQEISPIAETPIDSIDIFTKPSVTLRIGDRVSFQLEEPGTEQIRNYRTNFQQLVVSNKYSGEQIPGTITWNTARTVATFAPAEVLPAETPISITATVHFEEMVGLDQWQEVLQNGSPVVETKSISFVTGKVETEIPNSNIQYMYPSHNQKRYLPKEAITGFIKLKRSQPNILALNTPIKIVFTDNDSIGSTFTARDCQYNVENNIITYTIPILKCGKIYNSRVYTYDSILIYSFNFQSSAYNTFNERIAAGLEGDSIDGVGAIEVGDGVVILRANQNPSGALQNMYQEDNISNFDKAEITGTQYTGNLPLIYKEAILDDSYYTQDINPNIYSILSEYEPEFIVKVAEERRLLGLGTPPKKAIEVSSEDIESLRTEGLTLTGRFPYEYTVPDFYEKDLENFKEELLDKYLVSGVSSEMTLPEHAETVIQYQYPSLPFGLYKAKLEYTLPDGTVTTIKKIIYDYRVSSSSGSD